ncbi:4-hydroxy-3-methylbut-2-enyl diphosphate reductase [Curvivirga sp.]|uniref:4-hydroxy-3-methylbut-2-enyl diphosphate reductase n=1 Tax=Curvivirga sp. TaxID=2856848 RepID=UPI003B5B02AA
MTKQKLEIVLAGPRGFCAGVDRAILIVEEALKKFGAPVYVRHEIVHNRYVVESLENKGAIFVDELDECPADRPVVFSAHGVPKSVPAAAEKRQMIYLDATCPLVSKVHRGAERHFEKGRHIILIGHAGHPEVIGTMGQLDEGAMTLVETVEDVEKLNFPEDQELAYATQTTLSVDETKDILAALQAKFPQLQGPKREDICYATTNRQAAMKAVAEDVDLAFIIGAPNSSNSKRLVDVAKQTGDIPAYLIQRASEIDWSWFDGIGKLGISAGASAPEILVEEVIEACREKFDLTVFHKVTAEENIEFKLPRLLKD